MHLIEWLRLYPTASFRTEWQPVKVHDVICRPNGSSLDFYAVLQANLCGHCMRSEYLERTPIGVAKLVKNWSNGNVYVTYSNVEEAFANVTLDYIEIREAEERVKNPVEAKGAD